MKTIPTYNTEVLLRGLIGTSLVFRPLAVWLEGLRMRLDSYMLAVVVFNVYQHL